MQHVRAYVCACVCMRVSTSCHITFCHKAFILESTLTQQRLSLVGKCLWYWWTENGSYESKIAKVIALYI